MTTMTGYEVRDPEFPHVEIWAVLAATCDVRPVVPLEFIMRFPKCREYRFMGALGFGGKIHAEDDGSGLRVTCYSEDETPARRAMIDAANALLAARKVTP